MLRQVLAINVTRCDEASADPSGSAREQGLPTTGQVVVELRETRCDEEVTDEAPEDAATGDLIQWEPIQTASTSEEAMRQQEAPNGGGCPNNH